MLTLPTPGCRNPSASRACSLSCYLRTSRQGRLPTSAIKPKFKLKLFFFFFPPRLPCKPSSCPKTTICGSLMQRRCELPLTGIPRDTLPNVQEEFQDYLGFKLGSVGFDSQKGCKKIRKSNYPLQEKGNFSRKNFPRKLGLSVQLKESSKDYTQL